MVAQGHRGREGGSRGTATTLLPGNSCVLILQRKCSLAATAYQLWLADAQQPCAVVAGVGRDLNEVRLREQHSSNIALAVLVCHAALYEGIPSSSCQVGQ